MTALGGYRQLPGAQRVLAGVVFIGTLFITAALERIQFRLKASENSVWWASNGRDVVNLFALGTMTLGLHAIGFTGPISFTLAATLVVLLSAMQLSFEKRRFAGTLTVGVAMLLGVPVLVAPREVHAVFTRLLLALFP